MRGSTIRICLPSRAPPQFINCHFFFKSSGYFQSVLLCRWELKLINIQFINFQQIHLFQIKEAGHLIKTKLNRLFFCCAITIIIFFTITTTNAMPSCPLQSQPSEATSSYSSQSQSSIATPSYPSQVQPSGAKSYYKQAGEDLLDL